MIEDMKILSAPIQGTTDCHWRNAHNDIFGGVDCYYGTFLRIEHGDIRKRDLIDIAPDNNNVAQFIPQILGCQAQDAARLATTVVDMGYKQVDINLGCPFPPIALHHKGSGLLQYPDEVEQMFKTLSQINNVSFSIKMRLGWDDSSQWRSIIPLFDIINPTQVTVHPRTGRQQYKGELFLNEFQEFAQLCHYPIVFNGELKTIDDIKKIKQDFPNVKAVMIGRGLIEDPAMLCPEKATADNYCEIHNRLLEAYKEQLNGGEHQLLLKMKSLWQLFLPNAPRKALKAIKKSSSMAKYSTAVSELFYSFE